MDIYQTKIKKLSGTRYADVYEKAYSFYLKIKKNTKRRPYIRSAYFNKEKIFLGLFWHHLWDKLSLKEKTRRLKYFPCALELIKNSHFNPISKEDPNKKTVILHRFIGITAEKEVFFVQIKEIKSTNQKYLISVFPKHR